MTHILQPVSPLRQRMTDDMRMRQLAPKTQASYLRIVREFTRFLGCSPDTATVEDLRRYQLHLVDHGVSPASLNALWAAGQSGAAAQPSDHTCVAARSSSH